MSQAPDFNSTDLIAFVWKKRKPLIIVTIAAAIISVAVSLMLPVYYKATATVFPTRSNSVDFQGTARNSVVEFGDEADAERLLQVLISPEIRDSLTNKYDLYDHYDIDSAESQARFKFQKAYEGNVQFNRTRYNSITIDVFDTDPVIAADMANDIVRLVDTVLNRMIRERSKAPMWAVAHEVDLIKTEMGDYSDRIKALSDSGVVGVDARANLNSDILEAKRAGDKGLVAELEREKEASAKYGADFDLYTNLTEFFSLRYSNILDVNDQAVQYASTNIQQTIRHSMAEVPDKKAKPKRLIIVMFATFATLFFALFAMLAMERIKELRAKA